MRGEKRENHVKEKCREVGSWPKLSQDRVHWRSIVDRPIQLPERYLLFLLNFSSRTDL
jgi:hypothetical protein